MLAIYSVAVTPRIDSDIHAIDQESPWRHPDFRALFELYELRLDDGPWQRVRVVEASPKLIRLKKEDFGAIGGPRMEYTVPFPAPERSGRARAGSGN